MVDPRFKGEAVDPRFKTPRSVREQEGTWTLWNAHSVVSGGAPGFDLRKTKIVGSGTLGIGLLYRAAFSNQMTSCHWKGKQLERYS